MILDKLENADLYSGIHTGLKKGFEYLAHTDLNALTPGYHEIEGKDLFALVSDFETKGPEECRLEAHRAYADIQYIVYGREAIGFATLNNQEITTAYTSERDIVFFDGEATPLNLEPGMFVVFFPQDVHQPGMWIDGPEKVRKVVIKVKM
ncbi:MAG TPA: YhcH/YjgK/YiaL family protein [Prolixibacteraceae bacterium]|jgi:YhcH/YjgK/YiaL family protein|nr:YhcH/YjgK/YiaL family protein [Prolixibacteraceae bacterium]